MALPGSGEILASFYSAKGLNNSKEKLPVLSSCSCCANAPSPGTTIFSCSAVGVKNSGVCMYELIAFLFSYSFFSSMNSSKNTGSAVSNQALA